ncbi:MAG: hypothetical protein R8F63_11490 [Acidimicrobiales bacterium]|nr:hypothetical protein [Acidimicrobiales bacterium]
MRARGEADVGRTGRGAVFAALALALVAATFILLPTPAGADRAAPVTETTTTVGPGDFDPGPIDDPITVPEPIDVPAYPGTGPDEPDPGEPDPEEPGDPEAEITQPEVAAEHGFAIEIHGGVRGLARAGQPLPVAVEIAAQRLITGELRLVATEGDRTVTAERTIEVPGSSTKRFVLVAPLAMGAFDDLVVELSIEGEVIVSHEVVAAVDPQVEIVGVMGLVSAADSLPATAELAVPSGSAVLVGLDTETLGAGLAALSVFDSIVASAADLDALAGREFEALSAWVTAGGQLVVDEVSGPVPRIPEAWQPATGEARTAGRGLVRLSAGEAKVGAWDTVLLPTPIDDASEAGGFDLRAGEDEAAGLDAILSEDAGFSLPSIVGILILLTVYALVVGPIGYLVLRRRGRTDLIWVTVPAVAAIATVGVIVLGADLRDNTSAAHLTVLVTGEGTDVATTHVLVDSEESGIRLPRGWTSVMTDVGETTRDALIEGGDEGSTARLDLDAGDYGRIAAIGPVEAPGLVVEATSDGAGRVEGRVVNETDTTLHDVSVLTSAYGQSFGSLGPGEERTFSLSGVDGFELRADAAALLWGSSRLAAIDAWEALYDERGGVNTAPIGAVAAVGWSDSMPAPVTTADGTTIGSGRTVVVSHHTIDAAPGSNMATRLEMVRGPAGIGSGLSATYQGVVDLPDGTERVAVTIPRFALELEVWNGTRWQSISTTGRESTRNFRVEDVVIDGLIHVTMEIDRRQVFEFANGKTLAIGPVDEDEAVDG